MKAETAVTSLASLFQHLSLVLMMLGVAFLLFDLQYLLMSRLPGSENEMCIMGAGLMPFNIVFALTLSILGGVFLVAFVHSLLLKSTSMGSLSLSGVGAFLGMMTVFCAACTIPIISFFGLAIGLGFFTTYELWIKILSLTLMIIGLYQLDRQFKRRCTRCLE